MKSFFTIIFFSFICVALSQTSLYGKSPQAVKHVDDKNFSGLWYEIARTYNSFEKNCVAATVEYKLVKPYEYEVINRCFEHEIGGNLIIYNGTAQPLIEKNMSQIEKTYFWIFSKDYKIVYLDNYTTAVMVDETMENVWIMHRKPFLNQAKLNSIVSMLGEYMDISKLIFTPQDQKGRYK